nr:reverse transcriptase domain-containing protein [Tanacetum cinerariifolium]
ENRHAYLVQNEEVLGINLDLLDEKREQAAIREAKSKAKMEKYYNSKVRSASFKPGVLAYRNNDASHAEDTGKLSPKWEGPYEVMKALGKDAYKLRDPFSSATAWSYAPTTSWSSTEIGSMELTEAKVVDSAVLVSAVAGAVSEVPSILVKTAAEKGSARGTKTSRRADLSP